MIMIMTIITMMAIMITPVETGPIIINIEATIFIMIINHYNHDHDHQ